MSLNTLIARHVRLQEFFVARLHYINHKTGKANTADELEKAVIVFDMAELGMSPDLFGINYVKQMFGVDGNYYPERYADTCLFYGFLCNLYSMTRVWQITQDDHDQCSVVFFCDLGIGKFLCRPRYSSKDYHCGIRLSKCSSRSH